MSLIQAARHGVMRNPALGRSYAEISRFARTRYHGITFRSATSTCLRLRNVRGIHSDTATQSIEPGEELKKSLDGYKETLVSPWKDITGFREGSLIDRKLGSEVSLKGYITAYRKINKKLSFAVLRNESQNIAIQLVTDASEDGSPEAEAHDRLRTIRSWTPVIIKGKMKERAPPPKYMKTDSDAKNDQIRVIEKREVVLTSILPLNEIPADVFLNDEAVHAPSQRHLQLRMDQELRENLMLRYIINARTRDWLRQRYWKEIETPLLFKSTPEGAREFLVPTRNKGFAYALPQSPQQYKQILMASGINRYFQFAKCFRDEDLRADRQPEFTQLDLEMSFADEEQVMSTTEELLRFIFFKQFGMRLKPFPRLTYQEAMTRYGSDKPDLRYPQTIFPNIRPYLPADLISKITPLRNPTIDALRLDLSDDPRENRKFITTFLDSPEGKPFLTNPDGQPALFIGDASKPQGGLGPLGHAFPMEAPSQVQTTQGQILILQARRSTPFQGQGSTALGNLRLALCKAAAAHGLIKPIDPTHFEFLWVTDFPLFTPSTDSDPGQGGQAGLSSTHHPFTAPKSPNDVDLLLTDPTKAIAAHYDVVANGVELGGGSRRIHNAAVQEFIFRDVLKMKPERIEDFRHLLNVLRSGCPPHAGLALGWDRLIAMLCGRESVRDVIAFPKSGRGEDGLVGAPNLVTEEQWGTYHLDVKK